MFTYQMRPRVFRIEPGQDVRFPADCELRFHFQPEQPFGTRAGGGRTAIRAVAAKALFNANTGQHVIESNVPLSPLDVTIEEPARTVMLAGNALTLFERFESIREMEAVIEGVYFLLPVLLNVPFADPPYIERVDGRIGKIDFRWELAQWGGQFRTTTQLDQEQRFADAWGRMETVAAPSRRRLTAGLHYFHVACRLAREGCVAGEFIAEVLLNLSKTLEVLFPPAGDGRTRDAVRAGLRSLGLSDDRIERDFLPAMALRNEIDVGHVELGLFTVNQLKTIHSYTERAETAFREMLETLLARVQAGEIEVASSELGPPRAEAIRLIARLASMEGQAG